MPISRPHALDALLLTLLSFVFAALRSPMLLAGSAGTRHEQLLDENPHSHSRWRQPQGQRQGKRRLLCLWNIAEGAYGRVMLARDVATGKRYAVKRINLASENAQQSYEAELRALRTLAHAPNIVRLLDVFESLPGEYAAAGTPAWAALVMPYYERGSLQELFDAHAFPLPSRAARWFRRIAAGVAHAHALGIGLRDIKPANILLRSRINSSLPETASLIAQRPEGDIESNARGDDEKGYRSRLINEDDFDDDDDDADSVDLVLADFGSAGPACIEIGDDIARRQVAEFAASHVTAQYRAPELHCVPRAPARLTPAYDVFALGCVLHYMFLETAPPFDGSETAALSAPDAAALRAAASSAPPASVGQILDCVASMLVPDAMARPTAAHVVAVLDAAISVDAFVTTQAGASHVVLDVVGCGGVDVGVGADIDLD